MTSQSSFKALLVVSLSVVSFNAFAAVNHDRHHDYQPGKTVKVIPVNHPAAPGKSKASAYNPHVVWKNGDALPKQYRAKHYHVYGYNAFGLQRPGKNQQWFKIKGDYVLVNLLNHRVVNIVTGR